MIKLEECMFLFNVQKTREKIDKEKCKHYIKNKKIFIALYKLVFFIFDNNNKIYDERKKKIGGH